MNLKNYTSGVPVDTTVARIERFLVDAGATGIMKEFKSKQPAALLFQIPCRTSGAPEDILLSVRLPANVEACLDAFWADYARTRSVRSTKVRADFIDQAARTAWKLQQDWVEVQISLIRLHQQEMAQAFLPYIWDGQQTFYERVRESKFRGLLPAPKE